MPRSLLTTLAMAAALALLIATAVPVAAFEFKGHGFYARFGEGSDMAKGLIVVDRTTTDKPRMTLGITLQTDTGDILVKFRSIGCGGTPSPGNLVFGVVGNTQANGTFQTSLLSTAIDFDAVRSVWIDIDQTPACSISFNFDRLEVATGDVNGDGAIGLIDNNSNSAGAMALVEKRANGRARVTIVVDTAGGNDKIDVRGVNRPCGTSPTSTAFKVTFTDVLATSFKSKTVNMGQDTLDGMRSLRVHNLSTGEKACAPLGIIAILIGL